MKRLLVLPVIAAALAAAPSASAQARPADGANRLIRLAPGAATPVVSLGVTATSAITVTNVSDRGVRIIGVEVFGDNLGVEWDFARGCFNAVLAPGATCTYSMSFTPVVEGRVSGTFCATGLDEELAVADRECNPVRGMAL
jgi:hypothetical protein